MNKDIDLLQLFQKESDFEKNIFKNAFEAKNRVKEKYQDSIQNYSDAEFDILTITVDVEQVGVSELPVEDPDQLKLYLRKYVPHIEWNGNFVDKSVGNWSSLEDVFEPKIVPDFFNTMYSQQSLSLEQFSKLTSQLFCLILANKLLVNPDFKKCIGGDKRLLLNFKNSITKKKSNSDSLLVIDLEHRILNEITKLKSNLNKNNAYAIGVFLGFNEYDSFIQDWDASDKSLNLKSLFLNDYLLLNNDTVPKATDRTNHWSCDILIPPQVLEKKNELLYLYCRARVPEPYLRCEIIWPENCDISKDESSPLISEIHKIVKAWKENE